MAKCRAQHCDPNLMVLSRWSAHPKLSGFDGGIWFYEVGLYGVMSALHRSWTDYSRRQGSQALLLGIKNLRRIKSPLSDKKRGLRQQLRRIIIALDAAMSRNYRSAMT